MVGKTARGSFDQPTPAGVDAGAVRLDAVSKRFRDTIAVDGVDLSVEEGEFFSLLGPSGSGKTTCLRMIAGFEFPTSGTIALHGVDVTNTPPYDRDVNTVFQDYALFPHMTVAENVGYGLMVRRVGRRDRARRVDATLAMVQLEGLEDRKPRELSGGQRQRVALARALINEPSVLLLDEPLGALDLKLRQQMQIELKALQQRVGLTFIYVTHDQEEALTMSDRMAVLNRGRIEQVGSPANVYERPATEFVAGFVGVSNVLHGASAAAITQSEASFTIRPEKIRIAEADGDAPAPADACATTGVVRDRIYLGAFTRFVVELDGGGQLVVVQQNLDASSTEPNHAAGAYVRLTWDSKFNRSVQETTSAARSGDLEEDHE